MTGFLFLSNDRPDIIFEDGSVYGALHCGDCIEAYFNQWVSARLEYTDNWVLVIHNNVYSIVYGTYVRIP